MATLEHGALRTARRHELLEEWVDRLIEAAAYVVGGDLDVKGGPWAAKTGDGLGGQRRDRTCGGLLGAVLIERGGGEEGIESQEVAVALDGFIEARRHVDLEDGFRDTSSEGGHEGRHVDQPLEFGYLIGGFRDDGPTVTVADQHHGALGVGDLDDVAGVVGEERIGLRAVSGTREVEGGPVDASSGEHVTDLAPAPRAAPRTVDENVGRFGDGGPPFVERGYG